MVLRLGLGLIKGCRYLALTLARAEHGHVRHWLGLGLGFGLGFGLGLGLG